MKDNVLPNLVISDVKGKIYVHPELKMMGSSARNELLIKEAEIIPLPKGSRLFYLPGHLAVGYDSFVKAPVILDTFAGRKVYAAAASLIPGYTRLLLPAAKKMDLKTLLPLWAYTAVGWKNEKFWVSAIKIDNLSRQQPHYYENRGELKRKIKVVHKNFPKNRLFKHLIHCALAYNCRAAQNLFFGRWEAPLPTSPICNCRCLGCLSLQDSGCAVASHSRIQFVPSADEISEVAVFHFKNAKEAIVSFGQGCEGEPLLQFKVLKEAIIKIRKLASKGTIHLNTNAHNSNCLKELARAGLNSVRISINSLDRNLYNAYYRPREYKFENVIDSVKGAKKYGLFVSLNLLVFPGITDTADEVKRLVRVLEKGYVDLLQMRNLCIDPDIYIRNIPKIKSKPMGIKNMVELIKKAAPSVRFGYFNLPKEKFK